jgi:hypothetical protein
MQIEEQHLSEKNNFYSTFRDVSKMRVKEVFENNGWLVRKSNWGDFELANNWSELTLEGDDEEPLLNGTVVYNKTYLEILDKTLNALNGHFDYEFYDDEKNLLLEKRTIANRGF